MRHFYLFVSKLSLRSAGMAVSIKFTNGDPLGSFKKPERQQQSPAIFGARASLRLEDPSTVVRPSSLCDTPHRVTRSSGCGCGHQKENKEKKTSVLAFTGSLGFCEGKRVGRTETGDETPTEASKCLEGGAGKYDSSEGVPTPALATSLTEGLAQSPMTVCVTFRTKWKRRMAIYSTVLERPRHEGLCRSFNSRECTTGFPRTHPGKRQRLR